MLKCLICNHQALDLTRHIKSEHNLSISDYKKCYKVLSVVDPLVEEKRKLTCEVIYGDPNYRNEDAKKLSNEIYEGGHSLKDPVIREKGHQTRENLYGDKNFNNRSQAKQTCLKKYGVDNVGKVPDIIKKRNTTLIEKYGKIFNYTFVPPFKKEDLFELHVIQNLSLLELAKKYDLTPAGISYWMKKWGIKVSKKIVLPKNKEYLSPKDIVLNYLSWCLKQNILLSFYEYASLTESKRAQRMKRLFNTGRSYNHLLGELKEIALQPDKWSPFLEKITHD